MQVRNTTQKTMSIIKGWRFCSSSFQRHVLGYQRTLYPIIKWTLISNNNIISRQKQLLMDILRYETNIVIEGHVFIFN